MWVCMEKVHIDHVNDEWFLISNGGFSWLTNKVTSDYNLTLHKYDNGESQANRFFFFLCL